MDVFDFVKEINYGKRDIIMEDDNPRDIEKIYNSYIINKTFMYFQDSILAANRMNMAHELPDRMQFGYYLNTLSKRKRFERQSKKVVDDKVDIIKQYYGYSDKEAKRVINLVDDDTVKKMKKQLKTGGV